jgi:hypothetical protein
MATKHTYVDLPARAGRAHQDRPGTTVDDPTRHPPAPRNPSEQRNSFTDKPQRERLRDWRKE